MHHHEHHGAATEAELHKEAHEDLGGGNATRRIADVDAVGGRDVVEGKVRMGKDDDVQVE